MERVLNFENVTRYEIEASPCIYYLMLELDTGLGVFVIRNGGNPS